MRNLCVPFVCLLLTTLAACVAQTPATISPVSPLSSPTATVVPAASLPPGLDFPRLSPPEGLRAEMQALLYGSLIVEDGCLRVSAQEGETYTLIWPHDFSAILAGDTIAVMDGTGTVVARQGEGVRVSGGETGMQLPDNVQSPTQCPGRYWVVGSEVSIQDQALPPPTATDEVLPALTPSPLRERGVLAGLIYKMDEKAWSITASGQSQLLGEFDWSMTWSPEGTQVIYADPDSNSRDWMWRDLLTGETRPLTLPQEHQFHNPRWWPAHPEWLIFGLDPEADSYGYVALVRLDNGETQILDAECMSHSVPSPAPVGTAYADSMAYSGCGQAWLYHKERGAEPLNLSDYGFEPGEKFAIGSPAWSPDGKQLAWVVGGFLDGPNWQIGVLVLDLEQRTHDILFTTGPMNRGGWPFAPVWSPDGQWLASGPWGDGCLLVNRVADKTERHCFPGHALVWSSDGHYFVYKQEDATMLVNTSTWIPQSTGLPSRSYPVMWLPPDVATKLNSVE